MRWPFFKRKPAQLNTIIARVDDSLGWTSLTGRAQDYSESEIQELYQDALTAWRKNPIAWRIISITTDYVVGDRMRISSPFRGLRKFIKMFWDHPQNRMDLRLEGLSDELGRSGDLFILLFRNRLDGMSYFRIVTKDRIVKIETAENDWEREMVYHEKVDGSVDTRRWLASAHPEAFDSDAVMLHFAVNRPVGALLGESDLTTMLPWLQRYSRMLEDRVRLHWAARAFLWMVTVPANAVSAKREQYRTPPEAGSIIIKDQGESWEAVSPDLKGVDSRWDMQAVRQMVDAGSGYPPHWRGEAGDANLATATAMQGPTERHLLRRQRYFVYILEEVIYTAYLRSLEVTGGRAVVGDYDDLFTVILPEISRWDNESLARASAQLSGALAEIGAGLEGNKAFKRLALRLVFKFAGEPQSEDSLDEILSEGMSAF